MTLENKDIKTKSDIEHSNISKDKTSTPRTWFSKLYRNVHDFFASSFLFAKNVENAGYELECKSELKEQISKPITFAITTILIALSLFLIWGGTAPLDSAAIAQGKIVLSGNHKTLQHLEGGVIEKIFVKDGDLVTKDTLLIQLHDTRAKASIQITGSQLATAKITLQRLLSEKHFANRTIFDDIVLDTSISDIEHIKNRVKQQQSRGQAQGISYDIANREFLHSIDSIGIDTSDPEIKSLIYGQSELFKTRISSIDGAVNILQNKIQQTKEGIKGLETQKSAIQHQIIIVAEKLSNITQLYNEGLTTKSILLDTQLKKEELDSRYGDVRSSIASLNESIMEIKLEIINTKNKFHNEINSEINNVELQLLELQEHKRNDMDILERTSIIAPSDGIVYNLQYHTIGGVISPGTAIMDIVPQDDALIIEAMVQTKDIDSMYVGLSAKIQLSAYKNRLVPRVDGKVIYVAADSTEDSQLGSGYYIAKIEIDPASIANINHEIKLYPGMPADVFIVKGTRTFLEYILSPILESFHRAFKEA